MSLDAPPPSMPSAPASAMAIASLVLGIVGVLGVFGSCCCCLSLPLSLCAPVAAFLGYREREAIRQGQSSPAGANLAQAGMILGLVGTGLLVLYVIGLIIYIGMVGFGAAFEKLRHGPSLR
jgi:hypothetical protein